VMFCRLLRHRSSSFRLLSRICRPEVGCSRVDEQIVSGL
jgi:hypothetical protein